MGVEHPPNGTNKAFAVGCGMCRELKIKNGDFEKEMEEQTKKLEEIKKKF